MVLPLGHSTVYTTIIDYDIRHKPVSELAMILPPDVTVADVSTEGLVDWTVSRTEESQELTVSISFEAVGRHRETAHIAEAVSGLEAEMARLEPSLTALAKG